MSNVNPKNKTDNISDDNVESKKPTFESITIGKLTFSFNKKRKEICAEFPIVTGKAKLISKQTSPMFFQVRVEINDEEKFNFKIKHIITAIGSNKKSDYYANLYDKMEVSGITPDYAGKDFNEKFKRFALDLRTANGDISEITGSYKWQVNEDENLPKRSWAEVTGTLEKFSPSVLEESKKILEHCNFLEYTLDTIGNRVKAQKPKITLTFLIAMSSCLDDALNSLAIASPGKGKSMISVHVYEVFPAHRRFEFNTESSVAGLINMTKFSEGSEIFKGKLLYLGDLGNENEQKNPKVQDMLSVFKQLMSRKQYTKIITDVQSDEGLPIQLRLEGCGAVMVECTSKNVESQFEDRAVRWSPDDGKKVKSTIRAYQVDELEKIKADQKFNENRPIVACGIDKLFKIVEKCSKRGFKILNPYGNFMYEIFPLDKEIGFRDEKHLRFFPTIVTLTNLFQRTVYTNKETGLKVTVVTPEDLIYTLTNIGRSLAYMLSPVPENIFAYINMIEDHYIRNQNWIYTYNGYQKGFANQFDDKQQSEFDQFVRDCKPIYAKDVVKLMSVESGTARGYLNDLVKKEILYLKRQSGKENIYYPVVNFDIVKKNIGASFLKPEGILELRDEIESIYEEFIENLEKDGYEKISVEV